MDKKSILQIVISGILVLFFTSLMILSLRNQEETSNRSYEGEVQVPYLNQEFL